MKRTFRQSTLRPHPLVVAVVGALLATVSQPGSGQTTSGIQEVVVTAQKREENLQTTPIAISALSSAALTNLGATSFEGVAKASPSISFTPYPSSSNLLILYMRGQGVSDPMQITSDGSVGLYSDGFYISRPQASTFDLADIERVEVLRGPQGTLYGRNTTGGAVNLISKKPTGDFGFRQSLTFGSRDLFRSLTTVDLPKWNGVSTKFTLLKSSKDGFVKNTGSSHDYGEEEQMAGRFSLRWEATDALLVDYFLESGNLDSTPSYYQNAAWNGLTVAGYPYQHAESPRSKTFRPIDLDLSTSRFESHGLTLTWDVNDTFQIKSLTGYRELKWDAYQDYANAFAFVASVDPVSAFPIGATSHDLVNDHQFSQEFQFIGNIGEQVQYVAGLYYFKEGASHFERYQLPDFGVVKDRDVKADAKSKAVYAQATWTPPILDDRLSFTAGGRYTKDQRSGKRQFIINGVLLENGSQTLPTAPNGAANDDNFSRFNPAFTVNYNWTDDISTYFKYVTGYKAGGASESGPIGSFTQTFSPEEVKTLELGLKSYWWERRVRLNLAAFRSKFDDMQLAFNIDPADSSIVQAYNAGKATVQGVEVELLVMPVDELSLSVDYAYLDPKFDRVDALAGTTFDPAVNPAIAGTYAVGQNIKEVFALPYAAQDTVNLAADYQFYTFDRGNLSAHLDYHFQSKIFDTATTGPAVPGKEFYQVPSYGVINGRITLAMDLPRGDHAKVALWGRNLANKEYASQVIGLGNGIATPGLGAGYVNSAKIWAEPPSYGVDLTYEY